MNTDSRSILASLRGFSLCAIVAALVVSALPVTTARAQGNSPTPTPPAGNPTPSFTQTPKPALTPTSRSVRSIPTPRLATRRIQENDAAAGYEIDVRYAAVNRPADAWLPFNVLSEAQAREVIADFKTKVAAMGVVTQAAAPTSTLSAEWEAFRATRDFISIRSTYGAYMAGAAHPTSFTRVINFDPRTGRNLDLADLFRPGADYLGAISAYCVEALRRKDVLIFPEGAEPRPENYANWNIGRRNLVITFDVYQVAPYAAGPQECQIPLRRLRRLLANPSRW